MIASGRRTFTDWNDYFVGVLEILHLGNAFGKPSIWDLVSGLLLRCKSFKFVSFSSPATLVRWLLIRNNNVTLSKSDLVSIPFGLLILTRIVFSILTLFGSLGSETQFGFFGVEAPPPTPFQQLSIEVVSFAISYISPVW